MKEKSKKNDENSAVDINYQRIKKGMVKEIAESQREEAEDFLKRFKDDTLTGL